MWWKSTDLLWNFKSRPSYLQHIHCAYSRGRASSLPQFQAAVFADKLRLPQVQYIGTDTPVRGPIGTVCLSRHIIIILRSSASGVKWPECNQSSFTLKVRALLPFGTLGPMGTHSNNRASLPTRLASSAFRNYSKLSAGYVTGYINSCVSDY